MTEVAVPIAGPRPVPKLSLASSRESAAGRSSFSQVVFDRSRGLGPGEPKDPLYMFLYMFGFINSVKSSDDLPQIDELFPRSSPNR